MISIEKEIEQLKENTSKINLEIARMKMWRTIFLLSLLSGLIAGFLL
ncbi:hypothetical protein [uncultured Bacteroides sp.]|nr:hypothetical protein [uncultured Bacteroides sp.]